MNTYPKIIPSLFFTAIIFGFVVAMPLAVKAADLGLVPCGLKDVKTVDPKTGAVSGNDADPKPDGIVDDPCDYSYIGTLITNITTFFIITGAAVSAVAFGYAGFLMMTAHGEMGKIEEAKAIFGKVVVGMLFMLSAWLIVHAIEAAFLDTSPGKFKSLLG